MERILDMTAYKKWFSSSKKRREALQHAHDIRRFEIQMYWKRAAYFWAFIAAVFTGYFVLSNHDGNPIDILILLNCLGLAFSVCWYLVNRGSKFWQTNWERHIETLEDEITGPLYKTTLDLRACKWKKLNSMYGYSVSKVNQLLSLLFVFIWIFLLIRTMPRLPGTHGLIRVNSYVFIGSTIIFLIFLIIFARTDLSDKNDNTTKGKKPKFQKRGSWLK